MLRQLHPELFQSLPCCLGIGADAVPGRELHVLVVADDREGRIQVLRSDTGLEEREHLGVPGRPRGSDELAPGAVTDLFVLHFIKFGETWGDAGFDGTFAEKARAEGVNRASEEAFEVTEGLLHARRRRLLFQREVEAAAELGCRLAGERHRGHVLDVIDATRHPGGHPLGKHLRLAGARSGLDQDVRQQLFTDDTPGLPVDRAGIRHARRASRYAFNFESSSLPEAWSCACTSHAPAKSHHLHASWSGACTKCPL